MNKKIKQLRKLRKAISELTLTELKCQEKVGQVLSIEERKLLVKTAKKRYNKKLKGLAKKLLNRIPTKEELNFINQGETTDV